VKLHGSKADSELADPYLREYGSDAAQILSSIAIEPALSEKIDPELPYTFAQVLYAMQFEMARTLEDVLSRRTRALLLDSRAALRCARKVAQFIQERLELDDTWAERQTAQFTELALAGYIPRE
jgi:glycerol-3-phosphate dehydrogenase